MGCILRDPPFEEWIRHMFDHPTTSPAWHQEFDADHALLNSQLGLTHVSRLFREAGPLLTAYSDAQVNDGLWHLLHGSTALGWLHDPGVLPQERSACIREVEELFRQVFLPRCTPHLSHVEPYDAGALNSACYMWWEIFPFHGMREPEPTCLRVMEATLAMPSIAVQESALHGIGHWAAHYPTECERAVDAFLASHTDLRPELIEYAASARSGDVL